MQRRSAPRKHRKHGTGTLGFVDAAAMWEQPGSNYHYTTNHSKNHCSFGVLLPPDAQDIQLLPE